MKLGMLFFTIGIAALLLAFTILGLNATGTATQLGLLNIVLWPLGGLCLVIGIVLMIVRK